MVSYRFDLYPRTDPNGTLIRSLTSLQKAAYRAEANGTSTGQIALRSTTADGQAIDPLGLQYIRVVELPSASVRGGFFLEKGKFAALSEDEDSLLTFSGAGTLAYLARASMAPHTYISPIFTGQDPFDDSWRLGAQSTAFANGSYLGAMLWRVIYEALHFTPGSHKHKDGVIYTDTHDDDRTESAIPAVTMTFDQWEDSSGNPWTIQAPDFRAQVGENVLSVVKRLMEAGLYVELDPDTFALSAWEQDVHRAMLDATGAAWGAGVVRFQSPTDPDDISTGNIKDDAQRNIEAHIKRSALWAGQSDVYGLATSPSDIPWEGHYQAAVADTAALEAIAAVQLAAIAEAGDTLKLRLWMEDDELNGHYLPWDHVLLDQQVTVHTGVNQWEFNEQTFPVAALTVELRQGGNWDCIVELGASYSATPSRQFQVQGVPAHSHPLNPRLCEPGTFTITRNQILAANSHEFGYYSGATKIPVFTETGGSDHSDVVKATFTLPAVPVWYIEDTSCAYGPVRSDSGDARMYIEYGPVAAHDGFPNLPDGAIRMHWADEGVSCPGPSSFPIGDGGNLVVQVDMSGGIPRPLASDGQAAIGTSSSAARCDHRHEHGELSASGTHHHDTDQIEGYAAGGGIWYNVVDYGATGDGVTDDEAAIQDAIDAAVAAGGGTVWFPAGTYIIGSTLDLNGDVHLRGSSMAAAPILASSFSGTLFSVTASGAGLHDLFIDHAGFAVGSPRTGTIIALGTTEVDLLQFSGLRTVSNGPAISTINGSVQHSDIFISDSQFFRAGSNGTILDLTDARNVHLSSVACFTSGAVTEANVIIGDGSADIHWNGGHIQGDLTIGADRVQVVGSTIFDAVTLTADSNDCVILGNTLVGTITDNGTDNIIPAAGGVTDHGALTGLADDDHPQYVLHTELETAGHWEPVTNGSVAAPEMVFEAGDVVMEWVPA